MRCGKLVSRRKDYAIKNVKEELAFRFGNGVQFALRIDVASNANKLERNFQGVGSGHKPIVFRNGNAADILYFDVAYVRLFVYFHVGVEEKTAIDNHSCPFASVHGADNRGDSLGRLRLHVVHYAKVFAFAIRYRLFGGVSGVAVLPRRFSQQSGNDM